MVLDTHFFTSLDNEFLGLFISCLMHLSVCLFMKFKSYKSHIKIELEFQNLDYLHQGGYVTDSKCLSVCKISKKVMDIL